MMGLWYRFDNSWDWWYPSSSKKQCNVTASHMSSRCKFVSGWKGKCYNFLENRHKTWLRWWESESYDWQWTYGWIFEMFLKKTVQLIYTTPEAIRPAWIVENLQWKCWNAGTNCDFSCWWCSSMLNIVKPSERRWVTCDYVHIQELIAIFRLLSEQQDIFKTEVRKNPVLMSK